MDAQRAICCPFDFTLAEDGWAHYGGDKVLQYLCFPRFRIKVRLYAGHVAVFDAVEYHCATRPFALVEGGLRSSVVLLSPKKYFSSKKTNHFCGQATKRLPNSGRVRGYSKKKAKLS